MSGPVDEDFTARHLPDEGDVLEFGCSPGVFTARMARERPGLRITGVDLYPAETTEGYEFVQSDVLDYRPGRRFDVVTCVSSFEHCGIETADFERGHIDVNSHRAVAEKLCSLLRPDGQLVVTCPFGPDQTWITRPGEKDRLLTPDALGWGRWGYRTFSAEMLQAVFGELVVRTLASFRHVGGDYFDLASWEPVSLETCNDYNGPNRRAVLCAVFEKQS